MVTLEKFREKIISITGEEDYKKICQEVGEDNFYKFRNVVDIDKIEGVIKARTADYSVPLGDGISEDSLLSIVNALEDDKAKFWKE
jgi:hypothetical protein